MLEAHGVYPILPTPFTEDLEVDESSLRRLVDFQLDAGVHGMAILGFMGEAHKLVDGEREQVVRTVVHQASGRVPVWVGVRALGTRPAVEQARQAERLGASAVFVAPVGVQDDGVLYSFYRQVADAIRLPVMLHDYPDSFNIVLSPGLIAKLALEVPGIQGIKLEDPPVGPKISRVKALAGEDVRIFGGLGGLYFLEELGRGAAGIMTGLAYPEILMAVYTRFADGDTAGAARIFDRCLPYIRYEFQPKIGLALRKYVYWKRGVIASPAVRHPGSTLDPLTAGELEAILARVGLPMNRWKVDLSA